MYRVPGYKLRDYFEMFRVSVCGFKIQGCGTGAS